MSFSGLLKVSKDSKALDSAPILLSREKKKKEGRGGETDCADAFEIAVICFCVSQKETNYTLDKDVLRKLRTADSEKSRATRVEMRTLRGNKML